MDEVEFCVVFKDVLTHESNFQFKDLTNKLLEQDPYLDDCNFPPLTGNKCYYKYPLYGELARRLFVWMNSSTNPTERLQKFELLEESSVAGDSSLYYKDIEKLLQDFRISCAHLSLEETRLHVGAIFNSFGNNVRLVLDILGIRHTVGSINVLPPPLGALLKSFCQPHKSTSALTAGARALSKHCHRDGSTKYWGSCTGNDASKNSHACTILYRILNDASWVNIHLLPHGVEVLEVRCSLGYGARWSSDGSEFRGFLEPQMADGHSVKWKH